MERCLKRIIGLKEKEKENNRFANYRVFRKEEWNERTIVETLRTTGKYGLNISTDATRFIEINRGERNFRTLQIIIKRN